MNWETFLSPVWLSVKINVIACLITFSAAFVTARQMTVSRRSRGKVVLETFLMLPLVLPPTVVGFVLLVLLGRRSWVGRGLEWLTGQPAVFTWGAAVIASAVVSFPLVYQTLKTGFASVDRDLEDAARSMGAGEMQVLRWVTVPLMFRSLTAAFILGFARGLGEFGATLMVAGNIPGHTRTVPTAIFYAVDTGNTALAWGWAATIVFISFLLLWLVRLREPDSS